MIIGTHNSGAYKLDLTKSFWSAANKYEILRRLSVFDYVKTRIIKTTLNQKFNISQQLALGCRAFDIRVSILNNTFYVNHTYCCTMLGEILLQIDKFLSKNATKVTLLLRPDWETRHTLRGRELELLNYVDDKIHSQLERGKIECFCDFPKTVLKYFKMSHYDDLKVLWFNVDSVADFEIQLEKFSKSMLNANNVVLNFVLTMKENASIRQILQSDLEKMARELNATAPNLIKKYISSKLPKVILFDFVNEKLITELNKPSN